MDIPLGTVQLSRRMVTKEVVRMETRINTEIQMKSKISCDRITWNSIIVGNK